MRVSLGHAGRGALCAVSSLIAAITLPQSVATPAVREEPRIPFSERYRAVQHGGIARAANSAATCQATAGRKAVPCPQAQKGSGGVNGDYRMTYIDVDKDPNTYNSSRAELILPKNATVSYARLYWGGNLRVGEQKPAKDNGRVLFAEPGGEYKQVLADTTIGHHTTKGVDGYSASADVTRLVRDSTPGAYTVGQINVAMGHSAAGAWGGWTLVVAYADKQAPLRQLAIWDGYDSVTGARPSVTMAVRELGIPAKADGHLGVVAYDGDRGHGKDSVSVAAGGSAAVQLHDRANPARDSMNSTIADSGKPVTDRRPSYVNTLGYDSDVFDLRPALTDGGGELAVRFATTGDGYHLGALFLQADTRR